MEFPNLVYKCPGVHQMPGGTFDCKGVKNGGELTEAIKEGWYPTLEQASNPKDFKLEAYIEKEAPKASPDPSPKFKDLSREELEAKAKDLKISFGKTIKDETLAERIIQAMEDKGRADGVD